MRSKQIAIPEGQYRNIFRFPREAWPALEGTGSELHRLTCIRNHFPKKKKKLLCHEAGVTFHFRETDPPLSLPFFAKSVHWGDYSFSKHLPRARTIIIFLQQFHFSILLSRIESRFLDLIRVGLRFLVAETRERRQALVKSRASTHVDNSIHPLTQEISRVYDSSVERPPSPIEQIPPLLLLSPYG